MTQDKKIWIVAYSYCLSIIISIGGAILKLMVHTDDIYIGMIAIRSVTLLLMLSGIIIVVKNKLPSEHIAELYSKIIVGNKIYSAVYFIITRWNDVPNSIIEVVILTFGTLFMLVSRIYTEKNTNSAALGMV